MAYELVCRPDDVHSARNCQALSNGRLQCLFIETKSGEHEEQSSALQRYMEKTICAELAGNETFIKYASANKQLVEAQASLAAMKIDEREAALRQEREQLLSAMVSGTAQKVAAVDAKIFQLAKDAEGKREAIKLLAPVVLELKAKCELFATDCCTQAVHRKISSLNSEEIAASAALSKAASPHVAKLAAIKCQKQRVSGYHRNADYGRFFVEQALKSN